MIAIANGTRGAGRTIYRSARVADRPTLVWRTLRQRAAVARCGRFADRAGTSCTSRSRTASARASERANIGRVEIAVYRRDIRRSINGIEVGPSFTPTPTLGARVGVRYRRQYTMPTFGAFAVFRASNLSLFKIDGTPERRVNQKGRNEYRQ
jgi:hypothetical protein